MFFDLPFVRAVRRLAPPIFLCVLILLTRLYKLNWGQGFYFHPDENNMATAITRLNSQNLNPQFFAYGQFPLYTVYFGLKFLSLPNNFANAVYGLRILSALFSCFSFIPLLLLAKKLTLPFWPLLLFISLLIFQPGLIQISHFGTTESIIFFCFVSVIYLSIIITQNNRAFPLLLISLFLAISIATKTSSLIFFCSPVIAILFHFFRYRRILTVIQSILIILVLTSTLVFILSPYTFLSWPDFISAMNYETGVATGKYPVFYTQQFQFTFPYLFQLVRVFPYVFGLPVFVLSLLAPIMFIFRPKIVLHPRRLILIFTPPLLYFIYFGQIYAKWTRFMSPLFFLPPLFIALLFRRFKNPLFFIVVIVILTLPGLLFFIRLYSIPDVRLQASSWIDKHIPHNASILSESGNVVDIPVSSSYSGLISYNFYQLAQNPELVSSLVQTLETVDYLFVPSRRVYANYANPRFPVIQSYYQQLFSGQLGFRPIKEFIVKTSLFLDDRQAEETWSVFDHPSIIIFQKTEQLDYHHYQTLLTPSLVSN